ncbi:14541_t:CDS:2 [Rhizophagus irregularis]|nr:14541_t:CDS:2 [Rhizophagus irregularis]
MKVALKELNNSENINSRELNELKDINLLMGKRMINDNSIEDTGNSDKIIKKIKLNKNDDYLSKELEFDIDNNNINISKFNKFNNSDYSTKEIGFDI